ncbi:MAG: hypothetical protein ACRDV9_01860 [Acidimicrobiia bacterium]
MKDGEDQLEPASRSYSTWEELVAYVRAGGTLPSGYPEDYEGNRTTLVGAPRPATTEELVLYFDEVQNMTEEEHNDPERVLEMLGRYGCDCVWDHEAGRAMPRPRDVSP